MYDPLATRPVPIARANVQVLHRSMWPFAGLELASNCAVLVKCIKMSISFFPRLNSATGSHLAERHNLVSTK